MYSIEYDGQIIGDNRHDDLPVSGIKCSLALSSAGSLDFSIPSPNPWRGKLSKMSAEHEVVLKDDGIEVFRGRVTSCASELTPVETISAEGQLAYLNDSVVRAYGTYEDTPADGASPAWTTIAPNNCHDYAEWLITQHNESTDAAKQYTIGLNDLPTTSILRSSTTSPSTKQEVDDKLVDPLGVTLAAYMADGKRYIDLRADGGHECSQVIEFGSNLLDFTRTRKAVDVKTVIIPRGKPTEGDEFGVGSLADGPCGDGASKQGDRVMSEAGVTAYGIIEEQRSYDGVETPEELLRACAKDLESIELEVESIEISAVDLHKIDSSIERIGLGEWVTASARPLGFEVALICSSVDIDGDDPGSTKYTLGAEIPTLSNGGKSTSAKIRRVQSSVVESVAPISAEAKAAAQTAAEAMTTAKDAATVTVSSTHGLVFKQNNISTVLTVSVFQPGGARIETLTDLQDAYGTSAHIGWRWRKNDSDEWSEMLASDTHITHDGFWLTVSPDDVDERTSFEARVLTD